MIAILNGDCRPSLRLLPPCARRLSLLRYCRLRLPPGDLQHGALFSAHRVGQPDLGATLQIFYVNDLFAHSALS